MDKGWRRVPIGTRLKGARCNAALVTTALHPTRCSLDAHALSPQLTWCALMRTYLRDLFGGQRLELRSGFSRHRGWCYCCRNQERLVVSV